MKTEKRLTIAVPAYNAERFLEKCLRSFCGSRILPYLEILVINDGSADGTASIAERYVKRYPDSFRLINKENGGHGSGINTAIGLASGKYFQVVDADDWVLTENLPALLAALQKADADIILCHYHMVDMATGRRQPFVTRDIPFGVPCTFETFMSYPEGARRCCFFHGMLYRTAFYRETGLRLSEHTYYEDQEYTTLPAYYAKTVLPLDLFVYQYLVGNASQSISGANQAKNRGQLAKILLGICEFYRLHPEMSPERQAYFQYKLKDLLRSYYAACLIKAGKQGDGLAAADQMRRTIAKRYPFLAETSEKQYRVALRIRRFRISGPALERLKRTGIYHLLRRFL